MLHKIETKQHLNASLATVWNFISSPKNLNVITPSKMNFRIISKTGEVEKMFPGQIIEYYISPVLNVRLHWVTEITHVKENYYFVDEQRKGPYAFWHHKHFIKEVDGGIEMTDIVHYQLPFGFLGRLVNSIFVKKQLEQIFEYRRKKLNELFNS